MLQLVLKGVSQRVQLHHAARSVIDSLAAAGHKAYVVGGCVRDLLMKREPKDWDVATSAKPGEVMSLFHEVVPAGARFGTVIVLDFGTPVEVTTFRREGRYEDRRHPSFVEFVQDIELDLARRDFTCNAIAMDAAGRLLDPFRGEEDIKAGIVRAVGRPEERFREDALRMMRAVRFACRFGWRVEEGTFAAIQACAGLVAEVSAERVGEELQRMLTGSPRAARCAAELLQAAGLLAVVIPELEACVGVQQNRFHRYDVWMHTLETLSRTGGGEEGDLRLRLAALLHDVGKPVALRIDDQGRRHFYGHDKAGAEIAAAVLRRLRFSNEVTSAVTKLIRHHMRLHHLIGAKDSALLRVIRDLGRELTPLLVELARADMLAKGYAETIPPEQEAVYQRLAGLAADSAQPTDVRRLAIDGHDVMRVLSIPEGPEVGRILSRLLDMVMDDPGLNTREGLLARLPEVAAALAAEGRAEGEGGGRRGRRGAPGQAAVAVAAGDEPAMANRVSRQPNGGDGLEGSTA